MVEIITPVDEDIQRPWQFELFIVVIIVAISFVALIAAAQGNLVLLGTAMCLVLVYCMLHLAAIGWGRD